MTIEYRIEYLDGYYVMVWLCWEDGKLHRTDGPAVIKANGTKEWWEHGKFIRREYARNKNIQRSHGVLGKRGIAQS